MALIPRKQEWSPDPFDQLEGLQREMNRLFNFSLGRFPETNSIFNGNWAPALDVYDNKDRFVIKAELPGLTRDEIDVSLEDNILTIKGEKKKNSEVKEEHYLRSERFYGSFQRSIGLPAGADAGKAKATFKDGVLELVLPKKEEAKPRQIKIDVTS